MCFFFSSRRRHTRLQGDWSSDVCSSDLLFGGLDEEETAAARPAAELPDLPEFEERERLLMEKEVLGFYLSSHPLAEYEKRSEERRVGKEWRTGRGGGRVEEEERTDRGAV